RQVEQLKGAGKFAQAVPLAQRLLAIAERKGPQSLEVADALDTLAGLYEAQSKFADAEPLLKRSLAIREKAPGQTGFTATRDRLAVAYDNLG
ncbi:tetratricopeptide repeat protein, partial [Microbacteriaceae bacterium K1510]|nr:tetratricopeptide repeat protein [Microbacteriaceae bacterium K1510]